MTALKKYDRLEATGLWRASPDTQRREVLLSFGETSLIIRDRSQAPLTHWSLPAIERLNPGQRPALFEPGPDAGESLEIEDDMMIDAIEKVRRAIARRRPYKGRVRVAIFAGFGLAIAALGTFWLPGALSKYALGVVPPSKRLAIGTALLGHVTRLTGDTCSAALGRAALSRLQSRVLGNGPIRAAYIVPTDTRNMVVLPGKILLLSQTLVENHDAPEVAAGYMLAASEVAGLSDPLLPLLEQAGVVATLKLLTTGDLPDKTLRVYSESLMQQPDRFPETPALIARFKAAKIPSAAFAYARDLTGETTLDLIEADPFRGTQVAPILSDGDWISLQMICERAG